MSSLLRTLFREPMITRYASPVSRALRRFENDWLDDDWPRTVAARRPRPYDGHHYQNRLNREFIEAVDRLHEFADEMDALSDYWLAEKRPKFDEGDLAMKRSGDGSLQLAMDVSGFRPEDIKINLVDDHLVIEAKNESSAENSYSKSEIKRWFKLPEDCKLDEIESNLTKDNQLLISLPSSKPQVEPRVRKIPINFEKQPEAEAVEQKEGDAKQSGQTQSKAQENTNNQRELRSARAA